MLYPPTLVIMTYKHPKGRVQTFSSQIPCISYQNVVAWKDLTSDLSSPSLPTLSSILPRVCPCSCPSSHVQASKLLQSAAPGDQGRPCTWAWSHLGRGFWNSGVCGFLTPWRRAWTKESWNGTPLKLGAQSRGPYYLSFQAMLFKWLLFREAFPISPLNKCFFLWPPWPFDTYYMLPQEQNNGTFGRMHPVPYCWGPALKSLCTGGQEANRNT